MNTSTRRPERRMAPALVGILALILVTFVVMIACILARPTSAAASPETETALPGQGVQSIERMGSTWTVTFDSTPWELKVMEPRIEPPICGTNYGRPCGLVETFVLDSECVYAQVDWPVASGHNSSDPKVCRHAVTPESPSPSSPPASPPSETSPTASPSPTSTMPTPSESATPPSSPSPTTTPPASTASPTPTPSVEPTPSSTAGTPSTPTSPVPTAGSFEPPTGSNPTSGSSPSEQVFPQLRIQPSSSGSLAETGANAPVLVNILLWALAIVSIGGLTAVLAKAIGRRR